MTSESNTITVTIQKIATGTFYAGTILQEVSTQEMQAEDLTTVEEVEVYTEVETEVEQEQETQPTQADDTTSTQASQKATQEKLTSGVETTDLQSTKKQYLVLNTNKKRSFAI